MNRPAAAEPLPSNAVPPVQHQGVRYEEDLSEPPPAGQVAGGLLAAFDAASGRRLWQLQVYRLRDDPGAPTGHPGVHFQSMALVPGKDELLIENEAGGQYRVDLAQRQVRQVGGPPEEAPSAPAAKPKP